MEPSVSFWDCGEYIATGSKLEIGHPPGSSLYQIIAAFFSIFSFGDPTKIALMVNSLSAISSAFTILFLFWTITSLTKIAIGKEDLSDSDIIKIIGSGLVGSLAFTFTDTFWFSAVESGVYAMGMMFISMIFWLSLKWYLDDSQRSDKWIVLISYIIGLSVGVHMLVMLSIPAVVFVFLSKRDKGITDSIKKFILANLLVVFALATVFRVIFPSILKFFHWAEIFFTNSLGMPFNSGTIIAAVVIISILAFGVVYSERKEKFKLNTFFISLTFMILGFSSWLMLPIRSNAEPPINESPPNNAVELLSYYNRDQYGELNILYGPMYTAYEGGIKLDKETPYQDGFVYYQRDYKTNKYVIVEDGKDAKPVIDKKHMGFFPRMGNRSPGSIQNYKSIVPSLMKNKGDKPTFFQNVEYFLKYQVSYMYLRYFMWNFAGRQNDLQGNMDLINGDWISGISFIDEMRLGPQDNLPDSLKNNKSRNTYYFLPLMLGLLGLFYHFKSDRNRAYSVMLLFVFTGIAITVYTNNKAFEPRERDYALVGSFYTFCIWIGFGVFFLIDRAREYLNKKITSILTIVICLLAVPGILAKENWDDHDRSNRYITRDVAKNYLDSCAENAILFSLGDNDTYPLWYMQEVEGYRTDVKCVNLSLLNTDWHIDQAKRDTYEGKGIPSRIPKERYVKNKRNIIYFYDKYGIIDSLRWPLSNFMEWITSDSKETKLRSGNTQEYFSPVRKIRIPVEKENVLKHGIVSKEEAHLILDKIDINIPKKSSGIEKKDMIIFDILNELKWTRPIYFTITSGYRDEDFTYLSDYLQLEGLTYKLVPIKTDREKINFGSFGRINTDILYKNLMNFGWGNGEDPNTYLDEVSTRIISLTTRSVFLRLATALVEEGKNEKAKLVLDRCMDKAPISIYGNNIFTLGMAELYYQIDDRETGDLIMRSYADNLVQNLNYYISFDRNMFRMIFEDVRKNLTYFKTFLESIQDYNTEMHSEYDNVFKDIYDRIISKA
ncbi:hypothetical protein JBKA6_0523 [Ichthyobacterium seriolicida]|uniref:DUF2723 domain-containing protein n=2 Tax=Ichthyobacterium seriolicida TaxID=242600 RepID=A0A1J1EAJ6_9FLAO|nr:hypothetical protein JBKA6_0523 [Ichthyobacterium seriolicida]